MADIILAAQYRIHPTLWGGMDGFISAMHKSLSEQGLSMVVLVPRLAGTDAAHYLKRSIPCEVLDGQIFFDSVLEYCSSHRAKILHTHFMPTLSAKYRRFGDSVGAVISTEHMSRPLHGWSWQKKLRTRASALIGQPYVSEIIHVSHYLEEQNFNFFGKTIHSKSSVIHNGVEIKDLDKHYPSQISASRPMKLISAGRLVPEKGFSDLIKVVHEIVKSQGPVIELDILGDGPSRADLERQAGSLLDRIIFFRGYVNDVSARFRNADLYVHCSFQEAFPFVLLEAGEAGIPAVAYDVGGNPEIISNEFNGALVGVGKIEEMVNQLIGYLKKPDELRRQGLNSRMNIEAKFTIEKMVKNYLNIYEWYLVKKI